MTWNEAAEYWVKYLDNPRPKAMKMDIEGAIDCRQNLVADLHEHNQIRQLDMFDSIAAEAIGHLVYNGQWSPTDMVNLLVSKQSDYGHGNIRAFGLFGVLVRLSDKLERFKNLSMRKADPQNETVQDTLLDIVGYCVIARMLNDGSFNLELASRK